MVCLKFEYYGESIPNHYCFRYIGTRIDLKMDKRTLSRCIYALHSYNIYGKTEDNT